MWKKLARRSLLAAAVVVSSVVHLVFAMLMALSVENWGTPSPLARGTGNDALWLGHAWVDGRKGQSDLDTLAEHLRGTGIRDLFVHAGPFNDDGTLDPALRPRARWFVDGVHSALPGVRVQAWLGAHPGEILLYEPLTRARVVTAVGQVLGDGFDGVHYDFEPVADGDGDLLAILRETRALTGDRGAMLSVSAVHNEPWQGTAACLSWLPGALSLWSGAYLHQVALLVDQLAVMAYDTGLPTAVTYAGYVRRATSAALKAVPNDVALLIGVPAYHEGGLYHHPHAETMAAAAHGIRLALSPRASQRDFGVAVYVDFTATAEDWAAYDEWAQSST